MSQQCANCDCSDPSQCKKKYVPNNELEPIHVVADSEGGWTDEFSLDEYQPWQYIPMPKPDDAQKMTQNYLDRRSKAQQKLVDEITKKFKKQHKRISYEKAGKLFEKSINKQKYKLTQTQQRAVLDYLKSEEMKKNIKLAEKYAKQLDFLGKFQDLSDLTKAIQDSNKSNNWKPIFKLISKMGIEWGIARGLAFIAVSSPVGILGAVVLTAVLSFWGEELLLPYIDNIIDISF